MRKINLRRDAYKSGAKSGLRRPERLTSLFAEGSPYHGWESHNWKHRRFYVLNLKYVIGALRLSHTAADRFLEAARNEILNDTKWPQQFHGDYSCSKVQIYPKNADGPKLLDKAVTIIVALEIASREMRGLNVYDHLRIIPAYYFFDGFTRKRLEDLRRAYVERSSVEHSPLSTFDGACSSAIGQPSSAILTELTQGFCVTHDAIRGILHFVHDTFGNELSAGSIRTAGDSSTEGLGTRGAAPSLRAQQRGLVEAGPINERSELS